MGILKYAGQFRWAGQMLGWVIVVGPDYRLPTVNGAPTGYVWRADIGDGYPMIGLADSEADAADAARSAVETAVFGR